MTNNEFLTAKLDVTEPVQEFEHINITIKLLQYFRKFQKISKPLCIYKNFRIIELKGVCHEIFQDLFWNVWIDLGLYKNLRLF